MTDEELILRLRDAAGIDQQEYPYPMCSAAADRIEALKANEATMKGLALDAMLRAALAEEWRDHDKARADRLEAKLAKAVEVLDGAMRYNSAMHGGAAAYNKRIKDTIAALTEEQK